MNKTDYAITIIDDNSAHRRLVRRALLRSGISGPVFEYDSLAAAKIAFAPEIEPLVPTVLFLVDLNLGDGRGSEFIRFIRLDPRFTGIPAWILSTSTLETDIQECTDAGAERYLIKSEDPLVFGETIAQSVRTLLWEVFGKS